MSVKERDPLTGHQTTGHEWNGIIELNTAVPRAVWFFIIVTHVWALVMWVLLPAWPLMVTYTKGILGTDQREEVAASVAAANQARAGWAERIDQLEPAQILADPELASRVAETGHQLFGDNCAGCHGANGGGGPGFPSLTDSAWLWGGEFDQIAETIRVGVNNDNPDARVSQMMAFGQDGILSREQIRQVVAYVGSLSGAPVDQAQHDAGATIFAENCVSCHGEDGTGDITVGAPNLTDHFWIYGGTPEQMFQTVYGGRQGWMPWWENRLTATDRKILALYVQQLGARAQTPDAGVQTAMEVTQ